MPDWQKSGEARPCLVATVTTSNRAAAAKTTPNER
jgi:hypothetical protein